MMRILGMTSALCLGMASMAHAADAQANLMPNETQIRAMLQQVLVTSCTDDLEHSHFGEYRTIEECVAGKLKKLEQAHRLTPVAQSPMSEAAAAAGAMPDAADDATAKKPSHPASAETRKSAVSMAHAPASLQQQAVNACDKSFNGADNGTTLEGCVAGKLKRPDAAHHAAASKAIAAAARTAPPHRAVAPEQPIVAQTELAAGVHTAARQNAELACNDALDHNHFGKFSSMQECVSGKLKQAAPVHLAPPVLAGTVAPMAPVTVATASYTAPVISRPEAPVAPAPAISGAELQRQAAASCIADLDQARFGYYMTIDECTADKMKKMRRSRVASPAAQPTIAVARAH